MEFRRVYRITVFVPTSALNSFRTALQETEALRFGNYADVLWVSGDGAEQFTPLAGSNPTVGQHEQTETVVSRQIVFSIPKDDEVLTRVLRAVQLAHPWEEPVVYVDESQAIEFCDLRLKGRTGYRNPHGLG
jgi:hypothetical protein